ncbi:MAG: peptidase M17, partial [Jatrophihabitantaceae bacterium]
ISRAGGADRLRHTAGEFARTSQDARAVLDASGLSGERLVAVVEGLVLGAYRFAPAGRPVPGPRLIELAGADDLAALERGLGNGRAGTWARTLANTRSATKTPAWLATSAARALAPLGVDVAVHDERWLAEHGFGGVLAVGAGSASAPRLIEAGWRPRRATAGVHVVLVGKGITFDTGGLNLKPGDGMRTMYTDMAGGAAVLGALRLVAENELPVRVSALVPAAENSISGSAMRPSDVITHYGGRTSEVLNTDAEGRLVLADALAYAAATLRPTALVDIATLTGAMKVALGLRTGGLFASDGGLARALARAGDAAGESLWRLPLESDYASTLRSEVADANNAPGSPGAITAALFLQPFTAGLPWAHLDIAGPGRAPEDDGILSKGATGFGARLLARWIESLV